MKNYLIRKNNSLEHYTLIDGVGIAVRTKPAGENRYTERIILPDAVASFGLCTDLRGIVHIVWCKNSGELCYTVISGAAQKSIVISKNRENVKITEIMLIALLNRPEVFYSADLGGGKYVLVRFPLDNGATPGIVATLKSGQFCISDGSVYFTDSENRGIMLSDGGMTVLAEGISDISAFDGDTVWKKDDSIFFNGSLAVHDASAEKPLISKRQGTTTLMWQSGSFVKYMTSSANGWNSQKRFLTPNSKPEIIAIQHGIGFGLYYCTIPEGELNVLAMPTPESTAPLEELAQIRQTLCKLRAEISELRRKIENNF